MQRIKAFFKRPSTIAFLAFTALYAVCMAFIFWGTWSLDKAPVEPDNATTYAINDGAKWFADVCAGGRFIPSDLMHVIGGMYFWQELQYALAAYLAALGVMFYLRGRRVPIIGAYGGGAAFGLMGYCFTLFSAGHLGWFIWLMYGPFAFGLVDRCVRKGKWRNWALLGVVLAWSSAQQPDLWLLFTALTFAYGVWCIVRERRSLHWGRLFAGVGVAAAVMFATGAPQFRRALVQDLAGRDKQIADSSGGNAEASGEGEDASREERWEFCTSWSLPPEDTLEFVLAEVHGGSNDPRVSPKDPYRGRLGEQRVVPAEGFKKSFNNPFALIRAGNPDPQAKADAKEKPVLKPGDLWCGRFRQHSLYFGILTVLFAFMGVVGWWKRRRRAGAQERVTPASGSANYSDVPFWAVAAVVVYLCALGRFTPFYRLVFALPFGDYLRAPVKFVHLLEFCTAVLAGYGFAWLQERFGATRAWVGGVLCLLAVVNVIDLARVDSKYLAVEDETFFKAANDVAEDIAKSGNGDVLVWLPGELGSGGGTVRRSLGLHLAETVDAVEKGTNGNWNVRSPQSVRYILVSAGFAASVGFLASGSYLRVNDDHAAKMQQVYREWLSQINNELINRSAMDLVKTPKYRPLEPRDMQRALMEDGVFEHAQKICAELTSEIFSSWRRGVFNPVGYYAFSPVNGIRRAAPQASPLVLLQVKDSPQPADVRNQPEGGAQLLTLLSVLMTVGVGAWAVVAVLMGMKKGNGAKI